MQAPRLESIVEDCATAAKSSDARDKYFATYVGEYASCSSKQLRSELPSLEVGSPSYCQNCAKFVHRAMVCAGRSRFCGSCDCRVG